MLALRRQVNVTKILVIFSLVNLGAEDGGGVATLVRAHGNGTHAQNFVEVVHKAPLLLRPRERVDRVIGPLRGHAILSVVRVRNI